MNKAKAQNQYSNAEYILVLPISWQA